MRIEILPPKTNPRWWLYAYSQGNSPAEQLTKDTEDWPGGRMTGYVLWLAERWREFCKLYEVRNRDEAVLVLGLETDKLFDKWLAAEVGAHYEIKG